MRTNQVAYGNATSVGLSQNEKPKSEIDRRNCERYPVSSATACSYVLTIAKDNGPTKIKDISTDGIGLLLTEPVDPGQIIVVGLANNNRQFRLTQLVEVIHCTQDGGYYRIGGNFVDPLPYEKLSSLVM